MHHDNEFITNLCGEFLKNNTINPALFDKFEVKRGLRNADGSGVMAGITNICNVHGYVINEGERQPIDGELVYRGYNVNDIVGGVMDEQRYGFEEVVYLLLFGTLPDASSLERFSSLLAEYRELPQGFSEDVLLKTPSPDIMNKLASSVLAMYPFDDAPEDMSMESEIRRALKLIAVLPAIMVGAYQVKRRVYDRESMFMHPVRAEENLAQSILSTLRNDRAYTEEEAKLLDLCLLLHAEHGGGNNSTFSCRVLTSTGTDAYAAYAGAIGSLKGPRHGGANIKVMGMLEQVKNGVKNWEDECEVANFLRKLLRGEEGDGSGLIYGMGHAIYTLSDPRAIILKKNAMELARGKEIEAEFRLLQTIERLSPELFVEHKGGSKQICANVDMYSGLVYRMLGIPSELFTPMFAVARMPGWCAHRLEEILTGKRIIRPAYKAVAKGRRYAPLAAR